MTTETVGHTPGPWTVETDDDGIYILMGPLKGDDEHLAVYTAPYNANSKYGGHEPSSRRIADARLIAAAPDLLAALQAVTHDRPSAHSDAV